MGLLPARKSRDWSVDLAFQVRAVSGTTYNGFETAQSLLRSLGEME